MSTQDRRLAQQLIDALQSGAEVDLGVAAPVSQGERVVRDRRRRGREPVQSANLKVWVYLQDLDDSGVILAFWVCSAVGQPVAFDDNLSGQLGVAFGSDAGTGKSTGPGRQDFNLMTDFLQFESPEDLAYPFTLSQTRNGGRSVQSIELFFSPGPSLGARPSSFFHPWGFYEHITFLPEESDEETLVYRRTAYQNLEEIQSVVSSQSSIYLTPFALLPEDKRATHAVALTRKDQGQVMTTTTDSENSLAIDGVLYEIWNCQTITSKPVQWDIDISEDNPSEIFRATTEFYATWVNNRIYVIHNPPYTGEFPALYVDPDIQNGTLRGLAVREYIVTEQSSQYVIRRGRDTPTPPIRLPALALNATRDGLAENARFFQTSYHP